MYLYEHPKAIISAGPCPCRVQIQAQKRIDSILDGSSGVPEEYRDYTFETWDAMPDSWKEKKLQARQVCEMYAQGPLETDRGTYRGLVLQGLNGTGKSGMAASITRVRALQTSFLWIDFRKFVRKVYETVKNEDKSYEELVGTAASVQFLIWDDFWDAKAMKGATDYLRNVVYDIMSERYNARLATLITTNVTAERLYDDFDPRIGDRILKLCYWQKLDGVNLRFVEPES